MGETCGARPDQRTAPGASQTCLQGQDITLDDNPHLSREVRIWQIWGYRCLSTNLPPIWKLW